MIEKWWKFNKYKYSIVYTHHADWQKEKNPNETAIRRVYTPSGGSRITQYSQLESDKIYVCAGQERFKPIK
jgi:hypothetical protein